MDGKIPWWLAILLAPVGAWNWLCNLFRRKPKEPPPPPTPSRWTESTFQDALAEEDRQTWRR